MDLISIFGIDEFEEIKVLFKLDDILLYTKM